MKGVFFTVSYLITADGEEYRLDSDRIRYGRHLPSDFTRECTKEELKDAIRNGVLPLLIYHGFRGQKNGAGEYLRGSLESAPKGIDITDVKSIEIKFTYKKVICVYTINELKDKLMAEEYIDMVQTENLNEM